MTSIINISENCSLDVYSNAVIVVEVWISDSVPSDILLSAALKPFSDQSTAERGRLTNLTKWLLGVVVAAVVVVVVVVLVLLFLSRDVLFRK